MGAHFCVAAACRAPAGLREEPFEVGWWGRSEAPGVSFWVWVLKVVLVQELQLSPKSCCGCFGNPRSWCDLASFRAGQHLLLCWVFLGDRSLMGKSCVWTLVVLVNQSHGSYGGGNDTVMTVPPDKVFLILSWPRCQVTCQCSFGRGLDLDFFFFLNCGILVIEMKEQKQRKSLSLPTVFSFKHKGLRTRQILTLKLRTNAKCDAEVCA